MRIIEDIGIFLGGSRNSLRHQNAPGYFKQFLSGEGFLSSRKRQQPAPSGWRRFLGWCKNIKGKYTLYRQIKKWAPSLLGAGALATLAASFRKPAQETLGRLFNQPSELAPVLEQQANNSISSEKEKAFVGFLGKLANKITLSVAGLAAVVGGLYWFRGSIGKLVNSWTDNVAERNLAVIAKEFKDPNSDINTAFHGTVKKQVQDMLQDPGVKQETAGLVSNAVQNTLDNKGVQTSLQSAVNTALMGEKAKTVPHILQGACSKKEERGIAIKLLNHNAELNRVGNASLVRLTEHILQKQAPSKPIQGIIAEQLENAIREDTRRTGDNTLKKWLETQNKEWLEKNIADQFKNMNPQALAALPPATRDAIQAINDHFLNASFLEREALLNDVERVLPKDPKKLKELGISTHLTAIHAHNPHNAFIEAFKVAESPPQEAISGGLLNNPDTKKQLSRLAADIAIDTVGNPSLQQQVNGMAQKARKSVSFMQLRGTTPIQEIEEACLNEKTREIALQLCQYHAELKHAGAPDGTALEAVTYNSLRRKHPNDSDKRTEFILSQEIKSYLEDSTHAATLQTWLNEHNQNWLKEEVVKKLKQITQNKPYPNDRNPLDEIEADDFLKASYEDRKALLDDFKIAALKEHPELKHDINSVLQSHIKNPHNELLEGFERKLGHKPKPRPEPEPETQEEAVSETDTSTTDTTTTGGETSGTQAPQQSSGIWSYLPSWRRERPNSTES